MALSHTHIRTHTCTHQPFTLSCALSRAHYICTQLWEQHVFLSGFYQFKPDRAWSNATKQWVMREANANALLATQTKRCNCLTMNSFPYQSTNTSCVCVCVHVSAYFLTQWQRSLFCALSLSFSPSLSLSFGLPAAWHYFCSRFL